MKPFDAIAFDKDGTIFDSERIYAEAFHIACRHFGFDIEESFREQMTGLAAESSARFLQAHFGDKFEPEKFLSFWRQEHRRIIDEGGLPLMPHADQAIKQAYDKGYPLALVTSDDHDGTLQDFSSYPTLFACFSVVVTIDDVAHGKPDAEPYERAAAYLGIPTERLLVIEDSRIGAQAAINAGTQLVYYPSSSALDETVAKQAVKVVTDLAELLPWK